MIGKKLPRTNKKRWLCLIKGKIPATSGARLRFTEISLASRWPFRLWGEWNEWKMGNEEKKGLNNFL